MDFEYGGRISPAFRVRRRVKSQRLWRFLSSTSPEHLDLGQRGQHRESGGGLSIARKGLQIHPTCRARGSSQYPGRTKVATCGSSAEMEWMRLRDISTI